MRLGGEGATIPIEPKRTLDKEGPRAAWDSRQIEGEDSRLSPRRPPLHHSVSTNMYDSHDTRKFSFFLKKEKNTDKCFFGGLPSNFMLLFHGECIPATFYKAKITFRSKFLPFQALLSAQMQSQAAVLGLCPRHGTASPAEAGSPANDWAPEALAFLLENIHGHG